MSLVYDYMPAVLYAIEMISQGHTQTRACDLSNITIPTFEKYVEGNEQLQDLLSDAIRRGNDALADSLLDPTQHTDRYTTDPKVMKVVSDNVKWVLGKRDQKRFGDKVAVEVNVTADKAIVEALQAGKRRAAKAIEHTPAEVIDAAFTEVEEPIPDFLRVDQA